MSRNKIKLIQKLNSEIIRYEKDLNEGREIDIAEKKIREYKYILNTLGVKSTI